MPPQAEAVVTPQGSQQNTPKETQVAAESGQRVVWTASEFIAHEKSVGWYFVLTIATLALAVVVYFITKGYVSVAVILVAGLLLGVYGSHQPRQLEYAIDGQGITIDNKHHSYEEFKSFAVGSEGAFSSLVLMPLKRFGVPITLHYSPDDEEKILALLNDRLPVEEHHLDAVDSLMRRIRF